MKNEYDFAGRLKAAIKSSGMTQRDLSHRVGVTETTISHYVNGERDPKGRTIADISVALGVSADYLLGLTERK